MKRAKLFLKRRLPVFAEFEEDERFVSRFDFFFPAVNRFDRRQNIGAGRKAVRSPVDSKSGARFPRPEMCSEREQEFLSAIVSTPATERFLAGKSSRRQAQRRRRK